MTYNDLTVEQLARIAVYEDEQCNGQVCRNTHSELLKKSKEDLLEEMLFDGCMDDVHDDVIDSHLDLLD